MKRSFLLVIVMLCALSRSPLADEQTIYLGAAEAIGLVKAVHLIVDDQVVDGCWLGAGAVEAKARLSFEQNGIRVYQEDFFAYAAAYPMVIITANGERVRGGGNSCYGAIEVAAWITANQPVGGSDQWPQAYSIAFPAQLYSSASIIFSPTNLDSLISDAVEGYVSDLIADIIAARRNPTIAEMLPRWNDEPLTQAEFNAIVEGSSTE